MLDFKCIPPTLPLSVKNYCYSSVSISMKENLKVNKQKIINGMFNHIKD